MGAARRAWSIELSGKPTAGRLLVREESEYGYGRASYELNLGCNYDCEHCYLGLKRFEGLDWAARQRLMLVLRDAGVLWLQITGGEPMIDRLFRQTYAAAFDMGMMLTILSNGSRLFHPLVLELLTARPPHRITLSVYGATEASYDGLTRRKGAFRLFTKGLHAGHEAGLPLALSMIVTRHNAHEVPQMRALAERLSVPMDEYVNMVPTIYGGAETLPAQSAAHLRKRKVFTGCNAGHTFFHVDPHGRASICKVGREPSIDLVARRPCRTGRTRRDRRPPAPATRRMCGLPAPGNVRHLHAPSPALPQGQRSPGHLLPAPGKEGRSQMTAVLVQLTTKTADTDKIGFVDDLDVLSESDTCSCSAGDDNPF